VARSGGTPSSQRPLSRSPISIGEGVEKLLCDLEGGAVGSVRHLFATLDAVVARAGRHLENDNDEATSHHDRFVLAESGARVHVVSQVDDPDSGGPQVGHVWSIQLSASAR
jgi:hypothetical protein